MKIRREDKRAAALQLKAIIDIAKKSKVGKQWGFFFFFEGAHYIIQLVCIDQFAPYLKWLPLKGLSY